jgi:hypothetical protein
MVSSQQILLDNAGPEAVENLERAIRQGRHWYLAVLEAIGRWTAVEEDYRGSNYRYLIAGEAFDWRRLAGRLCLAVDGLLPADDLEAFLFGPRPPLKLTEFEARRLIGDVKYNQSLNYFYGVTVEEALLLAVQQEVRKEWRVRGYAGHHDAAGEAYRRIYGSTRAVLLRRFRRERDYPQLKSIDLNQLKEFTYWLFKYRVANCDRDRVASDTRKALQQLEAAGYVSPW